MAGCNAHEYDENEVHELEERAGIVECQKTKIERNRNKYMKRHYFLQCTMARKGMLLAVMTIAFMLMPGKVSASGNDYLEKDYHY